MKQLVALGAALLVCGVGAVGCSNTEKGAEQDASNAGQHVAEATDQAAASMKNAADNTAAAAKNAAADASAAAKNAAADAAHETKVGAKNATAALEVTPKVKLAITADPILNNTSNHINVDSANGIVHLKGHVVSEKAKDQASAVAKKTLKEMNATDKLSNELTVTGK